MMRRNTGMPVTLGLTVRIDPRCSELLQGFLDSCRTDMHRLRDAMVTADNATIELLGHRLRFAGENLGLELISEVGGEIEHAAQRRDEPGIRDQVRVLQNFLRHVDVVV